MPLLIYNPAVHDTANVAIENATGYSVWGACWDSTGITSTSRSIVPMIRMIESTNRRRTLDNTNLPTLATGIQDSFAALRAQPSSRRVLFPNYLQDDGIGGRDLDNFTNYRNNVETKVQIGATNWDSPFQFSATSTNTQTSEAAAYWAAYLNGVEQNNAHFVDIIDDYESHAAWSLGGNRLTGGTLAAWEAPGDARLIEAVVTDSRFTDTFTHGDMLRGKSWANIVQETFLSLTGTTATHTTIMADWFGRVSPINFMLPWGVPNNYYAFEKALRQVSEVHRVERIFKPVLTKPWFTGTYSNYDTYNNTHSEWKFLRNENTHYGLLGGLLHTSPKVVPCPVLYGAIDQAANWGFKSSPVSEMDFFQLQAPGAGVTAYANLAYQGFVMDMQSLRSVIRANVGRPFKVYVRNPADTTDNVRYHIDQRYWKEMIFHAALSGCNPFAYFQGEFNSTQPLHDCLHELRALSKNGTFKACSNTTADHTTASDLVPLKEVHEKGFVSGGRICSGSLLGSKMWRVTVPPQIIGGTGGTSVNITAGSTTETITVSSTSRGFWYLSDSRPIINSISGI